MSFDCLLFGAGHNGKLTTFQGDFLERVMSPIYGVSNVVPFAVQKHVVGDLTYAIAVHPPFDLTPDIVDLAITASGMRPLD